MKLSLPLLCAGLALSHGSLVAQAAPASQVAQQAKPTPSPFSRPLQDEKRFAHLLNRLAFGARPGEVELVRKMGAGAWIESQLNPSTLDDSALEKQLAQLTWLTASPERLTLAYEGDTAGFLKRIKQADPAMVMPQLNARQRDTYQRIQAANLPERSSVLAIGQLSANKLARAISSKRQLQEVLVDFWSNHFNVDIKKGPVRSLKIIDEREVIRPHLFSTFRALLGASAHSPAMLWYLDNHRSSKEVPPRFGQKPGAKARGGLNENYAREIMELHTLGVDGGYTQKDVTEVARCFTGWSVDQVSGSFIFRPNAHDQGPKTVLGQNIPAGGGQSDGERVLDILAGSPATAKFIARKLCVRFVADAPPASLVAKVAVAFTASKGDLKKTYSTLFYAPEFLSEGAYHSKIKSPFEFTVSAVRALDGILAITGGKRPELRLMAAGAASLNNNQGQRRPNGRPLATEIAAMGQPLYSCATPNGYPEDSTKWVSASALVSRLNFALSLTSGQVGDVELKGDTFRPASLSEISASLLGSDISNSTRATVEAEAKAAPGDGARLRALLIGSPEFQRR
jgi:uncharacterized protein (DUF1800 family)